MNDRDTVTNNNARLIRHLTVAITCYREAAQCGIEPVSEEAAKDLADAELLIAMLSEPMPAKTVCGRLVLVAGAAYWSGHRVQLTMNQTRMIEMMVATAGYFVTYRKLYTVFYPPDWQTGSGEDGVRTNIRSIIRRTRLAFKAVDPTFDAIESLPKYGYMWRNC